MGKIRTFSKWLEDQGVLGVNPEIISKVSFSSGVGGASTGDKKSDLTVDYRPGMGNSFIDPDIDICTKSLRAIHSQLSNIFAKAREKAHVFRHPRMKAAFDKELMAGIDGVGRAHTIILPTARGEK